MKTHETNETHETMIENFNELSKQMRCKQTAFYAGAMTLYEMVITKKFETEDQQFKHLDNVMNEINDYFETLNKEMIKN